MLGRCNNPNDKAYKNYGGRGIAVCQHWRSFSNFLEDMGQAPTGLTIERINNNGNYEPSNCKWATHKEQENNKRDNVRVEFQGITASLESWAAFIGIAYQTLWARLYKYDWPNEQALTMRPNKHNRCAS